MRKTLPAIGLAACAFAFSAAPAFADVQTGAIIAERWCAECHLVGPDQIRAIDGVATFAEVARREDVTEESLRAFLASPHPRMPDMALTRNEIRSLVAYIESLE